MRNIKKTSITLAVTFAVIVLLNLTGVLPILGSFVQKAASPVMRLASKTSNGVGGAVGLFTKIKTLARENASLKDKLAELAGQLAELSEVKKENLALKNQMGVRITQGYDLLPTRILTFASSGFDDVVVLDKGERDGVSKGMVVVIENNMLGIVTKTSAFTSDLELLSNPNSTVVAQILRRSATGVVRGKLGSGVLGMDEIEITRAVRVGDLVTTSKNSNKIPSGLALGLVEEVETVDNAVFKSALVRPVLDYSSLDIVFIIIGTK